MKTTRVAKVSNVAWKLFEHQRVQIIVNTYLQYEISHRVLLEFRWLCSNFAFLEFIAQLIHRMPALLLVFAVF